MSDEVKATNIPNYVLIALSDLTNGALNYYKASKSVMFKHRTILDYLIYLQQRLEDETLCKEIAQGHRDEVRDRESRELEEIERLENKVKEISEEMCYQINLKTENANIIKEAIEYVKHFQEQWDEHDEVVLDMNDLLNILQGVKKIKLKVHYDPHGAYVDYNGRIYHISLNRKEYPDFTIIQIITEPIDTYVVIETRK